MKPNSYFTVVCLVCVGILACLLPQPSGAAAAADSTWHPNPAAQRHDDDDDCNKASVRAIHRTPVHHQGGLPPLSAPPPTAGADLSSVPPHGDAFSPPSRAPEEAPRFGFPLQPTVGFAAPPVASAGAPTAGEGYPFIGSNPTVPVPTGIDRHRHRAPTAGHRGRHRQGGGACCARSSSDRHDWLSGHLLRVVLVVELIVLPWRSRWEL